MEQLGLYRLIAELKRLAVAAWDYEDIEVFVGAGGIRVKDSGNRRNINFPFDGRTIKPDVDARDYFRAEILLRSVPSLHEEYRAGPGLGMF